MASFYGNSRLPSSAHLELTDRCNAGCPLCSRTSRATGGASVFVKNADLSLEMIRQRFCQKFIRRSQFKYVHLCGNYGDPLVHPQLFQIVEHFASNRVGLGIATNGSLRKPRFWKQLGKLLASHDIKSKVTFGLDGVDHKTHETYRKFTHFEKILENAQAFIRAGGVARWQFIVFDHNEHQIDQAREMASALGFQSFKLQVGNRIRPANRTESDEDASVSDKGYGASATIQDRKGRKAVYGIRLGSRLAEATRKAHQYSPDTVVEDVIPCKVKAEDSFFVSAEGFVFPCCWTALHYNRLRHADHPNVEETAPWTATTPHYAWSEETNVYHRTIGEIVRNGFFTEIDRLLQPGHKVPIWPCFKTCYHNANKEVLELADIQP